MAQYKPQCRICHKKINKVLELEDTDWIMPSKNYYYHVTCYNNWAKKNNNIHAKASDEEWFEALKYYLNHVIKAPIDYKKLTSQWNNFLKQKTKTAKGIYFSVKYFYEVQKGDKEKCQGGIGIVSHIYADSSNYWYEREAREAGICAKIEEQIMELKNREVIRVQKQKKKAPTKNLEAFKEIEELGEDE